MEPQQVHTRAKHLCRTAQAIRERSEEIRVQAQQTRRDSDAKLQACQQRWQCVAAQMRHVLTAVR